jgi:hypothetical protein
MENPWKIKKTSENRIWNLMKLFDVFRCHQWTCSSPTQKEPAPNRCDLSLGQWLCSICRTSVVRASCGVGFLGQWKKHLGVGCFFSMGLGKFPVSWFLISSLVYLLLVDWE